MIVRHKEGVKFNGGVLPHLLGAMPLNKEGFLSSGQYISRGVLWPPGKLVPKSIRPGRLFYSELTLFKVTLN